jgi:hypothetical protein
VTLTLTKVYKSSSENEGFFVLTLSPLLLNYNKMDFGSLLTFEARAQYSPPVISYYNG